MDPGLSGGSDIDPFFSRRSDPDPVFFSRMSDPDPAFFSKVGSGSW